MKWIALLGFELIVVAAVIGSFEAGGSVLRQAQTAIGLNGVGLLIAALLVTVHRLPDPWGRRG